MSIEVFLAFVAACALLALTPGPAMSLIVANGASFGARAGLETVAGNSVGLGLLVAAAVLGMSSIMALMAEWFDWVRWLGAAYLVWLGVTRIRRALRGVPAAPTPRRGAWFWQGFAVALSNPKVLLFLGAFFPHFVDPGASLPPQFALLGIGFLVTLAGIDGAMALMAGSARLWLTARRLRVADAMSGCLLIGGGIALAAARR